MKRPGHEACDSCPTCHLTHCPDCDDEGRACSCHALAAPPRTIEPPDDRGSQSMEYALMTALLVGILMASIGMYSVTMLEFGVELPAPTGVSSTPTP